MPDAQGRCTRTGNRTAPKRNLRSATNDMSRSVPAARKKGKGRLCKAVVHDRHYHQHAMLVILGV
jgi:hypothetical protein